MLEEFELDYVATYLVALCKSKQKCFEYFKTHHKDYNSNFKYTIHRIHDGFASVYKIHKIIPDEVRVEMKFNK